MELHTLGVSGGYTQRDVTEVAKVFTGWTLADPRDGGDFIFRPRLHEPGDKTVLGHIIKEGGEAEGLQVLAMLAHQPATAKFICFELAQRFVSDNPPPALVDAMAKTFLKSDGDLREVMRTMLHSREFWSPSTYRARMKTPLEFVASSLRITHADINDPRLLLATLSKMGMPLYEMQPPTGYSTAASVWINSGALLDRMNFGLALSSNKIAGTTIDPGLMLVPGTMPAAPDTAAQLVMLEQIVLSGEISKQTHGALMQQLTGEPPANTGTEGLAASTPRPEAKPAASFAAAPDPKQVMIASVPAPRYPVNPNVMVGLLLGSPEFQRK